jgi:NIMA (never in mitosis gene a)-related kinase
MNKLRDKEKEGALNEVRILASLYHPNNIAYKHAFFEENNHELCIVMEYAEGGDLMQKIQYHKNIKSAIGEEFIWNCFI